MGVNLCTHEAQMGEAGVGNEDVKKISNMLKMSYEM